jgi:bifunctional DNA-binding transcriptional regulator/antitoxin component of YhaV-PrlF toxin-antitoxin module
MQSIIISEIIHMDEDGQITIPRSILDLYDIHDAFDVEIQLMPDGTIQLIPQLPFPKSFIWNHHKS